MKKILLACTLGSILLLTGCSGNPVEKAREMMENGDYKAAVEILEQHTDDAEAAAILKEARLNSALEDAEAAVEAEDYSAVIAVLEDFKDNSEAMELYNSAKIQVYTEQLAGYWQNTGGDTLNLAYVKVEFVDGVGTAVLEHSVDNFYGYADNDVMWKSLKVTEDGTLSLSALHRGADYASKTAYDNIAAVLDPQESTISFSDKFFGEWKKITEDEAKNAAQVNPVLTKGFNGTEIRRSPAAIEYLGKRTNEAFEYVFSDSSYRDYNLPFYFYVGSEDYEVNSYLNNGYVINGGAFNDKIYCGMTYAQLYSLEEQGVITDLSFSSISTKANYHYNVNGIEDTIEFYFHLDLTNTYVTDILFSSDYYWQLWKQDYDNWQYQKQQEAQKYIVYSRDNVYPFIGNIKSYVNSPYGQLALAEPYMANLFLGDICFIENSSILDMVYFMMYQGDLLRTNYSITYLGRSYPVYRAVTVIE